MGTAMNGAAGSDDVADDDTTGDEPTTDTTVDAGVGAVSLLLVEDSHDDARFVERLVHERQANRRIDPGTPMIEVTNIDHVDRLADALERVRSTRQPDAILLDLMLPDSRGLTTVERMIENAPAVPIVVLTGRDEPTVGIEAIRRGAQDYLSKDDITGEGVLRALRYAMERSRTRRELADRNHRLDVLHRIVRRDIRNDLSVVIGLGDGLRGSVPSADVDAVESLLEAAKHATDLTDTAADVIDVISTDGVGSSTRDFHTALDAATTRVHAETSATVSIEPETPEAIDPVTVQASPMLESAFIHLLSEAVDRVDRPDPHVTATVSVTETHVSVTFSGDVDGGIDARHIGGIDPGIDGMGGNSESSEGRKGRKGRGSAMRVGSYLAATLFESFDGEIHVERGNDNPRITVTLARAPSRTPQRDGG